MYIKNLYANNFRNFDKINIEFSQQVNFFLGRNGQGKTNLLESLYLLIKGDSFRYSNNETFINQNKNKELSEFEKTRVKSTFIENNLSFEIEVGIEDKSKSFLLNKKKVSSSQIQKKFHCILFSPESLSFIKESSEFRRELIDEFLKSIHSKNVDIIFEYRKILRSRNKLLKENKEGRLEKDNFTPLFEIINSLFIKKACELVYARLEAINAIKEHINDHMRYISQENVDIFVDYVASGESYLSFSMDEIEQKLTQRLNSLKVAEMAYGSSLVGPHKHEIIFLYNQKDSRIFCSQGQQRAIILSFKMAQIVYHRKTHGWYPVLMLDDVLSELDFEKKMRLISFLEKINTQIFITATELDRDTKFSSSTYKIANMVQGKILD